MFPESSRVGASVVAGPGCSLLAGAGSPAGGAKAQARARLEEAIASVPGLVQQGGDGAGEFAEALLGCADPEAGAMDLRNLDESAGQAWVKLPASAWQAVDDWMRAQSPDGLRQIALPAARSAADLKGLAGAIGGLAHLELLCLAAPRQGLLVDLSDLGPQVARPHVVVALAQGMTPCEVLLPQHLSMEYDSGGVVSPQRLPVHRVPAREGAKAGAAGAERPLHPGASRETPLGLVYFSTPRRPDGRPLEADGKGAQPVHLLNLNGQVGFQKATSAAPDPEKDIIVCRHLSLQWIQDRQAWGQAKQAHPGKAAQADFYARYKSEEGLKGLVPASMDRQFEEALAQWPLQAVAPLTFGDFLSREFGELEVPQYRHFIVSSRNHAMALELRTKQRKDGSTAYVVNFYDPNRTATHRRIVVSSPDRLEGKPLEHWLSASALKAYGLDQAMLGVSTCPPPQAREGKASGLAQAPGEKPAQGEPAGQEAVQEASQGQGEAGKGG